MKQIIADEVLEKLSSFTTLEYDCIGIRLFHNHKDFCLIHGYGFSVVCSRYNLIAYMNEIADEIQNKAKKGTYFYVE